MGIEYDREHEVWKMTDWDGTEILEMNDGDAWHILDNMTDGDRARAAIGWLLVKAAEDERSGVFWTMARYLLHSSAGGYSELE